ncbi:MAG: phosphate ABC transporter permease PstA [Steroidobacteraceae bacterium]
MSEAAAAGALTPGQKNRQRVEAGLRRRYRAEARFRAYGIAAVALGLSFVALLFVSIVSTGWTIFRQAYVLLEVSYDAETFDPDGSGDPEVMGGGDFSAPSKAAMRELFPAGEARSERMMLYGLVSDGAQFELRTRLLAKPEALGSSETVWLLADDRVDQFLKGKIDRNQPADVRGLSDEEIAWIDQLERLGRLELRFNRSFFTQGDSREPEQAGIWGALVGSALTLLVTLVLSFPIGVAAAVYLEEFAAKNRLTDFIEVNINNLAAVPSIVFGLLGLAVFIQLFGLPRSAPLVGGLVLTLMTLPTIIIASRAALKGVPPSIREAALGMGASQVQMVMHHVLPLAMPGMLTGAIIGMARALGESAPLLMIGMVAFIVDVPGALTDPSTALPVQVYLWADSPERAFLERTSGAILVLLAFLLVMNLAAVILRQKFERRW